MSVLLAIQPADLLSQAADAHRVSVALQTLSSQIQQQSQTLQRIERLVGSTNGIVDAVDPVGASAHGLSADSSVADILCYLINKVQSIEATYSTQKVTEALDKQVREHCTQIETLITSKQSKYHEGGKLWIDHIMEETATLLGQCIEKQGASITEKIDELVNPRIKAWTEQSQRDLTSYLRTVRVTNAAVRAKIKSMEAEWDTNMDRHAHKVYDVTERFNTLAFEVHSSHEDFHLTIKALKYLLRERGMDLKLLYKVLGLNSAELRNAIGENDGDEMNEILDEEHHELAKKDGRSFVKRDAELCKCWDKLKDACKRKLRRHEFTPTSVDGARPTTKQEIEIMHCTAPFVHLRDKFTESMNDKVEGLKQEIADEISEKVEDLVKDLQTCITQAEVKEMVSNEVGRSWDQRMFEFRDLFKEANNLKHCVTDVYDALKTKADIHIIAEKVDRETVRTMFDYLCNRLNDWKDKCMHLKIFKDIFHLLRTLHSNKLDRTNPVYSMMVAKMTETGLLQTSLGSINNEKCISCSRSVGTSSLPDDRKRASSCTPDSPRLLTGMGSHLIMESLPTTPVPHKTAASVSRSDPEPPRQVTSGPQLASPEEWDFDTYLTSLQTVVDLQALQFSNEPPPPMEFKGASPHTNEVIGHPATRGTIQRPQSVPPSSIRSHPQPPPRPNSVAHHRQVHMHTGSVEMQQWMHQDHQNTPLSTVSGEESDVIVPHGPGILLSQDTTTPTDGNIGWPKHPHSNMGNTTRPHQSGTTTTAPIGDLPTAPHSDNGSPSPTLPPLYTTDPTGVEDVVARSASISAAYHQSGSILIKSTTTRMTRHDSYSKQTQQHSQHELEQIAAGFKKASSAAKNRCDQGNHNITAIVPGVTPLSPRASTSYQSPPSTVNQTPLPSAAAIPVEVTPISHYAKVASLGQLPAHPKPTQQPKSKRVKNPEKQVHDAMAAAVSSAPVMVRERKGHSTKLSQQQPATFGPPL